MPLKTCAACGTIFAGRKERVACSRACGNVVKRRPHTPRQCEHCNNDFIPVLPAARYCSKACSVRDRHRAAPGRSSAVRFPDCVMCGKVFCARNPRANVCSALCKRRYKSDWVNRKYATNPEFRAHSIATAHSRRAQKLSAGGTEVLLTYLIERDGGRCQVSDCCFTSRKVATLGTRGPRQPSIDHIIPLSKGGEHALHNVQLAHYRCNLTKNNRGAGDQLALVG